MPERIDYLQGTKRAEELLAELDDDVLTSYELLENDRSSQFYRRCVVRSLYSYIEATLECIKVSLRSAIRMEESLGKPPTVLSENEKATLGDIALLADNESDKHIPLNANIKKTFKLAAKIWGLNGFTLNTESEYYKDFLLSKGARNSLTHPRSYYDIQVTDKDMERHSVTYHWFRTEVQRLFNAKLKADELSLPEEDREVFRKMIYGNDEKS